MNSNQKNILVWDNLVRIFHWSLVASFITAYLTSEEDNPFHIYAGYTVLGLIIFRVIWGFIGTRYARFDSFLASPTAVIIYVKSLFSKKSKHYLGHNPVGGWMVLAMLIMLFMVTFSGLKLYASEEGEGPLAIQMRSINLMATAYASDDPEQYLIVEKDEVAEDYWKEFHELSTDLMLILIGLHIAGVVISSKVHKENLVKAMLTGKKTINK